jgi:hypothetical protein
MNLVFQYLEQKGIAPRNNSKPICWDNLIGLSYDMQIDRIPCLREEFTLYTHGMKSINVTLNFDVRNTANPLTDTEGLLTLNYGQLDFMYAGNHITLMDAHTVRYDMEYGYDRQTLIVEIIARDIIINSNAMGGM